MNLSEIKQDRLSEPERFLHDIFDSIEVSVSVNFPDEIYYTMNDSVMFEYNSKIQYLWYSHTHIFVVFRDVFEFNYQETKFLVKSMVEKYLNLMVNGIMS